MSLNGKEVALHQTSVSAFSTTTELVGLTTILESIFNSWITSFVSSYKAYMKGFRHGGSNGVLFFYLAVLLGPFSFSL
jgi:hypothetical protein